MEWSPYEHLRLHDGDETGLLAERGVERELRGVGVYTAPRGYALAYGDDRAPLGEAGAELPVLLQAVREPVEALGELLAGGEGHVYGASVNLDAGDHALV